MSELFTDAIEELTKNNQRDEHANTIEQVIGILRRRIDDSFSDENGDAWIYYTDGKRKRFFEVESTAFKDYIRVEINQLVGSPRESWVESIIKLFASEARRQGRRKIALRRTNKGGAWYLQINEDQTILLHDGLISIENSTTIFRNFNHQKPLEVDLSATVQDLDRLDKYLNFRDQRERELFKTILPAYVIPGIQKPIQLTRGPAGAAKSTVGRVTKLIIDPSIARDGIEYPKDDRDWEVNCREHDIILLDNLSKLTKDQQDELCRIVTGKTSNRRKLYSDKDSYNTNLKATILINAIDLTDLNSDFLDRAIIWELSRIDDNKRISDEEFYHRLDDDLPKIRGAIMRILAIVQTAIVDSVHIPPLRLRDFATYAVKCAIARNIPPDTFFAWFNEKVELQKEESIAQSPIIEPLVKFMESRTEWVGTASSLLKLLTEQEYGSIEGEGIHERTVIRHTPPNWFKTPEKLGTELSKVGFLLERVGLSCIKDRKGKTRTRNLYIRNLGETAVRPVRQEDLSTTNWRTVDEKRAVPVLSALSAETELADSRPAGGQQNKNSCPPISLEGEPLIVTVETVDFENYSSEERDADGV